MKLLLKFKGGPGSGFHGHGGRKGQVGGSSSGSGGGIDGNFSSNGYEDVSNKYSRPDPDAKVFRKTFPKNRIVEVHYAPNAPKKSRFQATFFTGSSMRSGYPKYIRESSNFEDIHKIIEQFGAKGKLDGSNWHVTGD